MSDVAAEIKVGDTAPDFNLKDQDQKDVKLSEYRGKKNVVLAFYPLDWSPVCTGENKCLTDDFPQVSKCECRALRRQLRQLLLPQGMGRLDGPQASLVVGLQPGSREEVRSVF